ncbi:MAG TPA: hypothetical protein DEP91_13230 [Sphingomonas bacterium]|uniref:Lysozyme inhibitor LprI-like N-terminal domain-containing protein n=1 Tax=Sphingomonas bacterium TaxID=1895847 RepID=A0A3D0WEC2_9SPHN|nr:hypothetical protein [Sphingomonas bacterium]
MGSAFASALRRIERCPQRSVRCLHAAEAIRALRVEQQAWRGWRDAHCNLMAVSMQGSSGTEIVRADCRSRMTAERIETIEKLGRP